MTIPDETNSRIREMEARFDRLLANNANPEDLGILQDYYENGLWMKDYRMDELGLLPPDLKRGILSEDGLYNFLTEQKQNARPVKKGSNQ